MDKVESIYQKALELFVERGYDNTPISLIAKTLGLSKSGLYHYVENKEHLLFKIHQYVLERDMIPMIEDAENIPDPEERLAFFLRNNTKIITKDASIRVLIHETKRLTLEHYKIIKEIWKRLFILIRDALADLETAGKIRKMNHSFAAFTLIGMCAWTTYWFDYSRKGSSEELADTYLEIFFTGIFK